MKDMVKKKRSTIGENHPKAKLTNQQVLEIRKLADEGISRKEIAKQFNVSTKYIAPIIRQDKWISI
jgi:DNA-binding NarL/FixJ family response regulator